MSRMINICLLAAFASLSALAEQQIAPEIDPSSGAAAITVLSGAILLLRARRRK